MSILHCLETAFPVLPIPGIESGFLAEPNSVFGRGTAWPDIVFGDENSYIVEQFLELEPQHRVYYLPAYLSHAIGDPFYRSGLYLVLYGWVTPDIQFLRLLSKPQLNCLAEVLEGLRSDESSNGSKWLSRKFARLIQATRSVLNETRQLP